MSMYVEGRISDQVEATVTVSSDPGGDITLEVRAPEGIEATLSQTQVNIGAGGSAEVGPSVRVNLIGESAAGGGGAAIPERARLPAGRFAG